MELKLLKDMLALIEERSFTLAAQRRNVTQPAFSRRIQRIENWLGRHIVERNGPHVSVTPAAVRMEARIRTLINQMEELRRQMDFESMQKKHIVFTMSHTHSIYLFSEILKRLDEGMGAESFSQKYACTLKSAYKSECLGIFLRGDADVFICDEEAGKTSIPSSFRCISVPIGSDNLTPVASRAWAEATLGENNALPYRLPLVVYPEESYLWSLIASRCLPRIQERYVVEIACQTALSAGIRDLVLRGRGIGWLPRSFVDKELASGQLISLDETLGGVELDLACYISEEVSQSEFASLVGTLRVGFENRSLILMPWEPSGDETNMGDHD